MEMTWLSDLIAWLLSPQKKFYSLRGCRLKSSSISGFSLNKTMKSIIIQVNSDNSHEYECTLILSFNSLKDTVIMKKGDNLFNLVQSKLLELFFLEDLERNFSLKPCFPIFQVVVGVFGQATGHHVASRNQVVLTFFFEVNCLIS